MADQIELSDLLDDFSKEVADAVKEAQDEVAKETVDELKFTSPMGRSGKYARGWTLKRDGKNVTVYNSKSPGLTHLLEFGHATRDGGRTRAQPHIASANEKAAAAFEKKVKEAIERAN